MHSVTGRIKVIKQPYGGYVKLKDFNVFKLDDDLVLYENENIHSSLVGIVVDYLTRFMQGTELREAFNISLLGAIIAGEENKAKKLLKGVKNLDDLSIINACKLSGYDVCLRAGKDWYKSVDGINPDEVTIHNIRVMINRSIKFFKEYGPVAKDGFNFKGGYTDIVSSGDGDFLTKDTLWDFKVTKNKPTSKHTLQLLMYYLMGKKSVHNEFKTIKNLGIFNPRLNLIYTLEIDKIPLDVIESVERDVIGFK